MRSQRLWRAHDSADRRDAPGLEQPRDGAVRGNHEVFDELRRVVRVLAHEVDHLLVQYDRPALDRVDVERAVAEALAPERLGDFGLKLQLPLQLGGRGDLRRRGPARFEPCAHGAVGELCFVARDRAIQAAVSCHAVGPDDRLDDEAELVGALEQRAGAGREGLRQHRKIPDAGVHGRRLDRRVIVDGRARGHERVHVRDADAHPHRAVGQSLGDFNLIEITRRVVVDRRPQQAAQIAHVRSCRDSGRMRVDGLELGLGGGGKLRLEAVRDHLLARQLLQVGVPDGAHVSMIYPADRRASIPRYWRW